MATEEGHAELADELRRCVVHNGVADAEAREGALRTGAGETVELAAPFRTLTRTIGEASYRVTDEQVAAVREAAGSDKAAFEIIMAASIGAGTRRWDAATRAIREATNAAR